MVHPVSQELQNVHAALVHAHNSLNREHTEQAALVRDLRVAYDQLCADAREIETIVVTGARGPPPPPPPPPQMSSAGALSLSLSPALPAAAAAPPLRAEIARVRARVQTLEGRVEDALWAVEVRQSAPSSSLLISPPPRRSISIYLGPDGDPTNPDRPGFDPSVCIPILLCVGACERRGSDTRKNRGTAGAKGVVHLAYELPLVAPSHRATDTCPSSLLCIPHRPF